LTPAFLQALIYGQKPESVTGGASVLSGQILMSIVQKAAKQFTLNAVRKYNIIGCPRNNGSLSI
jgi:hypothetical protein